MSIHPVSPMLRRLRESATINATRKARELKSAGRDVLVISGGEPDFDTPDHIKQAGVAAIAEGKTKYTSTEGSPELKAAIVAKLSRDNGLKVTPNQVVVSTGAKQSIFNAMVATLSPGDEVVIPTPCWVTYPDLVELCGGKPVLVPCSRESGFKLTPKALAAAITPNTRWLILNSPSNPTGAVYSPAELRALGAVLTEHPNVMILSDEIYEYIVFAGSEFGCFASAVPALAERTLTVNGMSKGYAMTGWRIGYAVGPQWLISAMIKLQGQETNCPSSISQAAAAAALTGPHDFVASQRAAYQRRRDLVVAHINAIAGLSCDYPQGAFYVFVDASALIGRLRPDGRPIADDLDLGDYILEEAGVAVVPGTGFHASPYFRLCFAYSDDVLEDACDRIAHAVAALRASPSG